NKEAQLSLLWTPEEPRQLGTNNQLAIGDNVAYMRYLAEEKQLAGKIQLIYVDPPFYSGANYRSSIKLGKDEKISLPAYKDKWAQGLEEYLTMLCTRILLMKDLLSDTGCFWIHLDWHVVHYVKILLDEIFGEKNFVNEIIWQYKSGGTGKRHFSRKHDTLLFYSKTKQYKLNLGKEKSYNRGYKPYRFKGVKEYEDDLGWYTLVNQKDVWQIDMVGRTAKERTGYATQKPEALLQRIVESCSEKGDLCADFFGGSGTLAAVCNKLEREFLVCDIGEGAIETAAERLRAGDAIFSLLRQEGSQSFCGEVVLEKTDTHISLKEYVPSIEALSLDSEGEATIKQALEKDPLALISAWSVDFCYQNKVHRPQVRFERSGGELVSHCPLARARESTLTGDVISVKVVDIFGKSKRIEL
ncbi:MAG: site-specific DNA-methyltransferase, partial [Anaerovoracaceae bacterium]